MCTQSDRRKWFLGPTRSGISIGSSDLAGPAGLNIMPNTARDRHTDRHTDHGTCGCVMCSNRPHMCDACNAASIITSVRNNYFGKKPHHLSPSLAAANTMHSPGCTLIATVEHMSPECRIGPLDRTWLLGIQVEPGIGLPAKPARSRSVHPFFHNPPCAKRTALAAQTDRGSTCDMSVA